jgi:hypothetical protein
MKIKNVTPVAVSLLLALSITGCTYVSLNEAGSRVNQSSLEAVSECTLVGDVSSQTRERVLLDRNTGKVKQELIVLARNRAAELGATDLVQTGNAKGGTASFQAYRCD